MILAGWVSISAEKKPRLRTPAPLSPDLTMRYLLEYLVGSGVKRVLGGVTTAWPGKVYQISFQSLFDGPKHYSLALGATFRAPSNKQQAEGGYYENKRCNKYIKSCRRIL